MSTIRIILFAASLVGCGAHDGLDPGALKVLKTVKSDETRGSYGNVAIAGNYIYAGTPHGIDIIKIGAGADAARVGSYAPTGSAFIGSINVRGTTLYYNSLDGTHILDISTPESPTLLKTLTQQGTDTFDASDLDQLPADGKPLVPSSGMPQTTAVQLYDLTDPTNPTLAGTVESSMNIASRVIVGTTLYVSHAAGMDVFDVSSVTAPKKLGSSTTAFGVLFPVTAGTLYSGSGYIINVSNPAKITSRLLDEGFTDGHMNWRDGSGFVVDGSWLFVVDGGKYVGNVFAYDITDPASPAQVNTLVSFEDQGTAVHQVLMDKKFVYTAHDGGVSIFGLK